MQITLRVCRSLAVFLSQKAFHSTFRSSSRGYPPPGSSLTSREPHAQSEIKYYKMNQEFCIQLPEQSYYLNCWSVSGMESCVTVRAMDSSPYAFDIGHATRSSINCSRVFITHGHVDHCGALAKHVSQRDMRNMTPLPTYYCPKDIQDTLKSVCESYALMAESTKPALTSPSIIGVSLGDKFDLPQHRQMRPFLTTHRVPSNGYLLYKTDRQLLLPFKSLPSTEIQALLAAGTTIHETRTFPEIAYTGDTTFDCFLAPENRDILQSRILITEATYIDDRQSPAKARERGHMHLMDIAENAELFRQVGALVLVHLSDRYNARQVDYWMRRCLPAWLLGKTWVPTIAKDFE